MLNINENVLPPIATIQNITEYKIFSPKDIQIEPDTSSKIYIGITIDIYSAVSKPERGEEFTDFLICLEVSDKLGLKHIITGDDNCFRFDYKGELFLPIKNLSKKKVTIKKDEEIGSLRFEHSDRL